MTKENDEMKSLIKSATARQVGSKWEITAHFEDGSSEVILKRGANRGFVQLYQFNDSGKYLSVGKEDAEGHWVSFGKTIPSDYRAYHVRTIPLTEAA